MEPFEFSYGSDKRGLVWGYRFAPGVETATVDADAAASWIETAADADGTFLWLHFSLANAATEGWLRSHLHLPDTFYESLGEQASATRLEVEDDQLVAAFGMNVGGIPFADDTGGFIGIVVALVMLTAVTGYLVLRNNRD